jgi:hypothetical protein
MQVRGNVFGAYGFLINRSAALLACNANSRLACPQLADWPMAWRHRVSFFITDREFVTVSLKGSVISTERDRINFRKISKIQSPSFLKLKGWIKLSLNILGLEPLIISLCGVPFKDIYFENCFLYFRKRLLRKFIFSGDNL